MLGNDRYCALIAHQTTAPVLKTRKSIRFRIYLPSNQDLGRDLLLRLDGLLFLTSISWSLSFFSSTVVSVSNFLSLNFLVCSNRMS